MSVPDWLLVSLTVLACGLVLAFVGNWTGVAFVVGIAFGYGLGLYE